MDRDRRRQRVRPQIPCEPFPRPPPTIRSPIEPVPPATLDLAQKTTQAIRVPGDPVVPVVPPQLQIECPTLLTYWRMAVLAAPPPYSADRPTQAIRGRLLLDHPVPMPRLRPVVGEAQQVERSPSRGFRWPTRTTSPWRTEVDQSGLLWVQAQAVLAKSLRQHGQHPTCIFFSAKAQHGIVRVAHQPVPPDLQRLMRRPTRPKPVRAVHKVLLVDRFEHHGDRSLKNLVFKSRYPNRARGRAIALRDIRPLHRWRPVTPRLGAVEHILQVFLQVLRVRVRRLSVYTRRPVLPRASIRLV